MRFGCKIDHWHEMEIAEHKYNKIERTIEAKTQEVLNINRFQCSGENFEQKSKK